jgi:homoserine kinase
MGRKLSSWMRVAVVALWPLPLGGVLDLIDLALGDIAQGAAWSYAGALGVPTASAPATFACLFFRVHRLQFHLLAGAIERDVAEVRASWPTDLPRGVIHADLFPDNALFLGETLSGMIDFYFACTDFLAYDIAVCLNAWCFEEERRYDLARGGAMIAAYETIRPLSDAERDALPVLARGAGLRFFATRLADWAETPEGAMVRPKSPMEYADKLAFHRGAKGAGDYGA